jgi:hypothetical protein
MLAVRTSTGHPRFDVSNGLRGSPDACPPSHRRSFNAMSWTVTTIGDLPDEHERRQHGASALAWSDYAGRILELEIDGFTRDREEATQYGRRWACDLYRGVERTRVTIERTQ